MSNMDFFQIGALKVFAELGQLIEEDERNKIKFTDIPYDIIKIIKNHVTNFKDNEEEYNFLRNFKKGQNKDLYKYFFDKDPYYFVPEVVTRISSIEPDIYRYEYKFYLDHVNLDNVLEYVNKKYKKNYNKCKIIHKFRNGIQNKGIGHKRFISIGYNEIIINKNNKLQFDYGYEELSKEYNIPEKLETYLNNNVWNIKNIL
jgi:hypothetical protein